MCQTEIVRPLYAKSILFSTVLQIPTESCQRADRYNTTTRKVLRIHNVPLCVTPPWTAPCQSQAWIKRGVAHLLTVPFQSETLWYKEYRNTLKVALVLDRLPFWYKFFVAVIAIPDGTSVLVAENCPSLVRIFTGRRLSRSTSDSRRHLPEAQQHQTACQESTRCSSRVIT